ncbi:tetratricopeptide repeat protein [Maribellus sp. CM-23]|uniref:tetratricopeptide repeat protein n=1 Tax=Maribellus sp. CM-23 TaxID=2781026 RepID=UPI001F465A55|nr:tetratricopeptide repeat protein [Maribellus sp. CM-23]MCE4564265.1 tetratricopeptide repeat protein [Maribellus sp. CM-23]
MISISILIPFTFNVKNHPYQYVYFNELQGGVKNAYKYYETDYSCNGVLAGSEWLIENVLANREEEQILKIATNYSPAAKEYFSGFSEQTELQYTRYYEKSKRNWDYAVYYCAYISAYQLQNNLWPPKGTIYTKEVGGFPIAAVVKRVSHEDYEGFEALKKRRLPEAKQHFRNFLALYPESEEVLEGYSRAFLMERNLDSTLYYADQSLAYNPRQMGALLLKASALNTKKEYNEALIVANEMSEIKSDFPEGLFQKGFALKNLNQPNEALKAFQQAIAHKKDYNQAYLQMGEILINYKNYKKAIDIYDQLLKESPNDLYAKAYKAKSLQLSGDNIQAESIINSLPAANQNNVEVVKVKCRIALAKNDLATAANFINMARFINNDADLFALRAKFVLAQNNRPQAEAFLKQAAELDPINREVQELMKLAQPAGGPQITQQAAGDQAKTKEQQSVMFQKPKPKKTSPIAFPKR